MMGNRARSFLLATLTGLLAGAPAEPLRADDTEVYLGGTAELAAPLRPNVLFVLDTSSSMSNLDGGEVDRLDRMKEALRQILDNAHNINIGLMRFSDPGGPILYPVSYIDADVNDIETSTGADVISRVSDGRDDAEQLGLAVKLDSVQLELNDTPAFGDERSFVRSVLAGSDDADQAREEDGDISFYSRDRDELTAGTEGDDQHFVGMRFRNFPADTAGATVLHAAIEFRATSDEAGELGLTFVGHAVDDSQAYPDDETDPCPVDLDRGDVLCRFDRARTVAETSWSPPDLLTTTRVLSDDISPILQEIFDRPGWHSAAGVDDLSIMFTGKGESIRTFSSFDGGSTRAPTMYLDYVPAGAPSGTQVVGLRFRDVRVPQGMRIQRAAIELVPRASSDAALELRISAHNVDDAPEFTDTDDDIASRSRTSSVDWDVPTSEPWLEGSPVQTVDISSSVQQVVDRSSWCGGNDMVFVIESRGLAGMRPVHSFESDPNLAPVLRIEYDETTGLAAGEGCIRTEVQRQVAASRDDSEENVGTGSNTPTRGSLPIGTLADRNRLIGIRFREMPIPRGATILDAHLELVAFEDHAAGAGTVTINGEDRADAPEYQASTNDISDRPLTSASVTFSAPAAAVSTGERFRSPDIASIVREITDASTTWQAGNAMAFELSATGLVRAASFDDNAARAPIIRVTVQYNIGDLEEDERANVAEFTVRRRLFEVVDTLSHVGFTPIVDTLLEGAHYFRGEPVRYGASRGTGSFINRRETRLSHPASYTGGTVDRPNAECTDANLNDLACIGETIVNSPTTATYRSPIESSCQRNFIILLTDGNANNNHSAELARDLAGVAACDATLSNGDTVDEGEACGTDLVRFLNTVDQQPDDIPDTNTIQTYTIGFNFSGQFLRDLAQEGGGKFFTANTTQELVDVFNKILGEILNPTTSFAAPSLSINAFNRLFHRNEVYFSLFKPSVNTRWDGNVKKYQLCRSTLDGCEVGEVLDAREPPDGPQPAIGDDQRIAPDALSFWTQDADGADVLKGGAAAVIADQNSRRIFTYIGTTPADDTLLTSDDYIVDANSDGILDGLTAGTEDEQLQRTKELLGVTGDDVSTINAIADATARTAAKEALRDALHDQIQWIRGVDVDDGDLDGTTAESRYFIVGRDDEPKYPSPIGDPLHGSPVAVTYGAEDRADVDGTVIVKFFLGTNDGGLRMVNGHTGEEEWVFYPPELLPLQTRLRENPVDEHSYGLDGTPTVWINDVDQDGFIEPAEGDFIHVYIGMRRGGNLYYAVDVTPTKATHAATGLQSRTSLDDVTPRYLWSIRGGSADYPRLGQTWSQPRLARILRGTDEENQAVAKTVLVIGGGYDPGQDGGFGADLGSGLGNAVYIVDALTGEPEFWASGNGSDVHTEASGVEVPGMIFPIPSDVAVLDSNSDGFMDRMYVGDTGGQMWRIDIGPDRSTTEGYTAVVGRLASVSFPDSIDPADAVPRPIDRRKFFYPPDVVQVRNERGCAGNLPCSTNQKYDLVIAVTGNRATPLDQAVDDRMYAFRDYTVGSMTDTTPTDGVADNRTLADASGTIQGELAEPITAGDLFDVTTVNNPTDSDLTDLQVAQGYYLSFTRNGEKALAAPIVLAGKLFFTTYLPDVVLDSEACVPIEGSGLIYGLNVLNGAAIFNWDESGGGTLPDLADRTLALGAGIPSAAVPVFQPEAVTLLVGGGGGATVVNPNITLPRQRTYWFQQ
ncbi:MAG: VWA domain-containing protein [Chromatiales bacterium]|nr:VWA domain-containing protein [Chromatiales bacterium]